MTATTGYDALGLTESAARPRRVRTFDFDSSVTYGQAVETVRSALDDEGLALSDANTRDDRVFSVLTHDDDGRFVRRIVVPPSRIVQVNR